MNYKDALENVELMGIKLSGSDEMVKGELFDGIRIDPESVPSGKHLYWMRHEDVDFCVPVSISPKSILVNFYGSFVADQRLPIVEETNITYYGFE